MSSAPLRVGVIGAGVISGRYLTTFAATDAVDVIRIGDLRRERAESVAVAHAVPHWGDADEVIADARVDLVVNLTAPAAHAEISEAALRAGKHVWSEKPIALTNEDAARLLSLARAQDVSFGVAPDTILGARFRQALDVVRSGGIGTPLSAIAMLQNPGPDLWHPDPASFFRRGAGPLLDMGPYYVGALVDVFGEVDHVAAFGGQARDRRHAQRGPNRGIEFDVDVLTEVHALLRFSGGQTAQLTMSFDSPLRRAGFLEVTGSDATIAFPDPNRFDGTYRTARGGAEEWTDGPAPDIDPAIDRGLGVLEQARAIAEGGRPRERAERAAHVLEVLLAIESAAEKREIVPLTSLSPVPA